MSQVGALDWVALSKTTVSFSVEILARYARAGVEALTIAVGQALFAQFRIPADSALAEWLFSLRVEIIDHTGKPLYQSKGKEHHSISYFQLTVIRLEQGQNSIPQSLLRSRTHLVPPGDSGFNIRTATSYHLFYQGRSEWFVLPRSI